MHISGTAGVNRTLDPSSHMLVLDNNPFTRKLLLRMLNTLGCGRVVTCVAVPEALTIIDDEAMAIGLVLLDLNMPQIDVNTGVVVGAEALVRWQHPKDGIVGPDQFISLAEQNGLIDALTDCVLTGALAQPRAWHDSGLMLRISINVSMTSLSALEFPDALTVTVRDAGLAPQDIMLEITESRLAQDRAACLAGRGVSHLVDSPLSQSQ